MNAKCLSNVVLGAVLMVVFGGAVLSPCLADTFTDRTTGQSFNGYVVKVYRGDKTQVRTDGSAKYVDLRTYDIQRNSLGRKKQVPVFSFEQPVELLVQAQSFEEAIVAAANQGPLFILIELDAIGPRRDLARRVADAILATDTCSVYALITGEKVGGAFDAAAVIALACDRIYLRPGASIGALGTSSLTPRAAAPAQTPALIAAPEEQSDADWLAYVASVAKRRNRPEILAKAMFDENIEVVEVSLDDKNLVVDRTEVQEPMKILGTISDAGKKLTLSAQNAVRLGLADGVSASQAELLASLGASGARPVPNNVISRSRVAFDRDMRDIDRTLEAIAARAERQVGIDTEVKQIEVSLDSFQRDYAYGYTPAQGEFMAMTFQRRQALMLETIDLLSAQIADYQTLIDQTAKWPDLANLAEPLQQKLQTDAAKLNETRLKANIFF